MEITSGRLVLEFKERLEMKRTIKVFTIDSDAEKFKVVKGLNTLNHIENVTFVTKEELKTLWVDAVVNQYDNTLNLVFRGGIKECIESIIKRRKDFPTQEKDIPDVVQECL